MVPTVARFERLTTFQHPSLVRDVRRVASEEGAPLHEVVRWALTDWLADREEAILAEQAAAYRD